MKNLAMIVAASENDVIGVENGLPWALSADLKRFKKITMGHHIIMGRKTFDSIGRLLPGRTTVILTRQKDFGFPGAVVVHSIDALFSAIDDDEQPFVTGGSETYALLLPYVTELHLTRVHTEIEGDTRMPQVDWSQWELVSSQRHERDDRNEFDCSFEIYRRTSS
jgi:dihydrofolate reductase